MRQHRPRTPHKAAQDISCPGDSFVGAPAAGRIEGEFVGIGFLILNMKPPTNSHLAAALQLEGVNPLAAADQGPTFAASGVVTGRAMPMNFDKHIAA